MLTHGLAASHVSVSGHTLVRCVRLRCTCILTSWSRRLIAQDDRSTSQRHVEANTPVTRWLDTPWNVPNHVESYFCTTERLLSFAWVASLTAPKREEEEKSRSAHIHSRMIAALVPSAQDLVLIRFAFTARACARSINLFS